MSENSSDKHHTFSGRRTGEPFDLGPGSHVGVYTLVEPLGQGGMGQVWKANDGKRLVALKLLPPEFRGNADAIAQVDEAFQVVHALTHQHICKTLGLFDDPQVGPFLVLDYVPGMRLSQFHRQGRYPDRRMPVATVVQILRPIAEALDYAHQKIVQYEDREQQGVLHRDVKPDNILVVERDGTIREVWLIDFGLAAEIRNTISRHTNKSTDTRGTRPYMSPEQLKGKRHLWDGRTDQYSLAVVAYELLAGHLPFDSDDDFALMLAISQETPDDIDGLPEHVNAALLRSLAKEKTQRFSNCVEFVAALAEDTGLLTSAESLTTTERALQESGVAPMSLAVGASPGDIQSMSLGKIDVPFCWCPPGRFTMGSPEHEPHRKDWEEQLDVEFSEGFWMGQTLVTQELYEEVMQSNPSEFKGSRRPVEQVSWKEASLFCQKLTSRWKDGNVLPPGWRIVLPTWAQSEYACRAGTSTAYVFGDDEADLSPYAWYEINSDGMTHDVALKRPNGWGLHDVHGNVDEWCADGMDDRSSDGHNRSGLANEGDRVIRGGSWFYNAGCCRSAYCDEYSQEDTSHFVGFRVAVMER